MGFGENMEIASKSGDKLTALEDTTRVFKRVLDKLKGPFDNIVIGGSLALHMHGLKLGREVADIDVIIYKPTKEQLEVLELLKNFDMVEGRPYGEEVKCIKLKRTSYGDEFTMDILVETVQAPSDLLFADIRGVRYRIQSIDEVIKAKSSYEFHMNDKGESTGYARAKDLRDFLLLKNHNFNPIK